MSGIALTIDDSRNSGASVRSHSVAETSVLRVAAATVLLVLATLANVGDWRASLIAVNRLDQFQNRELNVADNLKGTNLNSAISYVLLGGFGMVAIAITLADRRALQLTPIAIVVAAYFAWCGLSAFWSPGVVTGIRKFSSYGLLLIGAAGFSLWLRPRERVWVAVATTTALIVGGFALELSLGTFRPQWSMYRFAGMVHPNIQAFYGVVLCIASSCLIAGRRARWVVPLLVSLGLACIWLTKSRSSLGGLLFCGVVVAMLAIRGYRRGLLIGGIGSTVCVAVLALSLTGASMRNRIFGMAALGRGKDTQNLTGRVPLWEELTLAVADRPITGYGFGSFWNAERVTHYSEIFLWEIPNAHSVYMDALLQTGVVGLSLFLGMILAGLTAAIFRQQKSSRAIDLFPIAILAFALIHGLTESEFVEKGFGGFWMLVCLCSLSTNPHHLQPNEPQS